MAHVKLSDELRTSITLARFEPLLRGRPLRPLDDLAHRYDISEKTIQKAIAEAFERNLVRLVASEISPKYSRNHQMERALQEKFRNIRVAIVVDLGNAARMKEPLDKERVQLALGHALAQQISQSDLVFRSQDIIGLGSGGYVYQTIKNLDGMPSRKLNDISIMSLSGSYAIDAAQIRGDALTDADTLCAMFSRYFLGVVRLIPISYPISHGSEGLARIRNSTWLSDDEYVHHTPTHAIGEINNLDYGHYMVKDVMSEFGRRSLAPIRNIVTELVKHIDEVRFKYDWENPVADFFGRLFVIEPFNEIVGDSGVSAIDKIKGLVANINQHLLVPHKRQISMIPNVMVLSGTAANAKAIHAILNSTEVSLICIDRSAAEIVLTI